MLRFELSALVVVALRCAINIPAAAGELLDGPNCLCNVRRYRLSVVDSNSGRVDQLSLRPVMLDGHKFFELYTAPVADPRDQPIVHGGEVATRPGADVDASRYLSWYGVLREIDSSFPYEIVESYLFAYRPKTGGVGTQPMVWPAQKAPGFVPPTYTFGVNAHGPDSAEVVDSGDTPSFAVCGQTLTFNPDGQTSRAQLIRCRAVRLYATFTGDTG